MGARLEHLRGAVRALQSRIQDTRVIAVSAIYETPAQLPEDTCAAWNQDYLNLAVRLRTRWAPARLLHWLHQLEAATGRERPPRAHNAPRVLDLDLLIYGERFDPDPELWLPHPRLAQRAFALRPLLDVLPHWRWPPGHPLQGQSGKRTLAQLPPLVPRGYSLTRAVGILNLAADSFTQTPAYARLSPRALHHRLLHRAQLWAQEGIDWIDLGAESTRPGATLIGAAEEWRRLRTFLPDLRRHYPHTLSLDTRHPRNAQHALELGVDIINDVSGLQEPRMHRVLRAYPKAHAVLMHHLGVPPSSRTLAGDAHRWTKHLQQWAHHRQTQLTDAGILPARLWWDPGLGFGKSSAQCYTLVRELRGFHRLGLPLFVGHSRKRFLSVEDDPNRAPTEREAESLAISLECARQGVAALRVHAPVLHHRALRTQAKCLSRVRFE